MQDELQHRGNRLLVIEQPGGGYLIEIVTPDGQTISTMTYQSTRLAIDDATCGVIRPLDAKRRKGSPYRRARAIQADAMTGPR